MDLRQKFLSLFPRRDCFIWKTYDQERWQKAAGPLLDAQIFGVMSDEGRGLFRGCYWSHKTRHAVLDIDRNSRYRNAAELQKLQEHFTAVGLYAIPYQSSDSGGWHLYLPFDEWAESDEVNQTLKTWLKSLGYEIISGQLEIFPSGNALRLPLQKGFAWLSSDGSIKVRREEIREDEALASFLQDFEKNCRNWREAKRLIDSQIHSAGRAAGAGVASNAQGNENALDLDGFELLWHSKRIPERIQEARKFLDQGLTEEGQRHSAIYAIQHLLWFGDAERGIPKMPGEHNDERRQQFLKDWLARNHNGKCRHVRRSNWRELDEHIRRACEWRGQEQPQSEYVPYMTTETQQDALIGLTKKTGYLWTPADLERANQKREASARDKIRTAKQFLLDQGRRVTGRQIMRLTGCSYHTVKKHEDIWSISSGAQLPRAAGDLDPGVLLPVRLVEVGFEKKEKSEIPFSQDFDFEEQEQPITAKVVPLSICLANSQPSKPQQKAQALRVPSEGFPLGPSFDGLQAEGQMWKREILLFHWNHAGRDPPSS